MTHPRAKSGACSSACGMARKRSRSQKKQKKTPARKEGAGGRGVSDYLRLLADPCRAPLVRAPYAGTGSGYLVRTVNTYRPYAIGNFLNLDVVAEFTPWNFPTPLTAFAVNNGTAGTLQSVLLNNFVTNNAVVRTYRPVAACLKWVPTGPISSRAGVVGRGYAPSKVLQVTAGGVAVNYLSGTMVQDPNGSVPHEVTWLPSFGDERFGGNGDANIAGAGSCQLVLLGVDAFYDGTANTYPNGYVEMTVVWEWEPELGVSSATPSGITPSTAPMSPYTLQQVLSGIRDVGRFVLGAAAEATMAYQYAVGARQVRGSSMPRLTM